MSNDALMTITCHIDGKNARAEIHEGYLSWTKTGRLGTGGKIALGAMTAGASLLATGIKGKKDEVIIPMKSITHVTSSRGKGLNSYLTIHTATVALELRCHHGDADEAKELLNQLISGTFQGSAGGQSVLQPAETPKSMSEKADDLIEGAQKLMGAFNRFRGK